MESGAGPPKARKTARINFVDLPLVEVVAALVVAAVAGDVSRRKRLS